MKTKIFLSVMSLALGMSFTSCEDEENYAPSNQAVLTQESVQTGSTDVTATTATLHGTVAGNLASLAASSFTSGFYYGLAEDALSEQANSAVADGQLTAQISGLTTNTTYYYQAFVSLQGRVTYKGAVKTFVTTDAKVATVEAKDIDFATALLGGTLTDAPADATCGIVISGKSDAEAVRAGLIVPAEALDAAFGVSIKGLLPATEYFYAAYLNVGTGVIYGDVKSFTTAAREFDLDNDLVDLGLSVKWARYNVGAKTENEMGGLYGYGDLTGVANSIDLADYATTNVYKTGSDLANATTDGKTVLPTAADFEELFSLCQTEWTEVEGVAGIKCTGPNGNSIFLPAAGSRTINATTEKGVKGVYMTGTSNETNSAFAVTYGFGQGFSGKGTTPVYQAVSVRPVSPARSVKFNKELLYNTWELDLNDEGEGFQFVGPVYFYGSDDSWRTLTNNEPILGDHWNWDADFAGNGWMLNKDAKNARGSMTFSKDEQGNDIYEVSIYIGDEQYETKKGTFTINEEEMTISLDGAPVLLPANLYSQVENQNTDIRILTQSENSLQLGTFRNDGQLLGLNYVTTSAKYGYKVQLMCGGDNSWQTPQVVVPGGNLSEGMTFSVKMTDATSKIQVFVLDFQGMAAAFPNMFARIDAIKADGVDVKFNANKFHYGDIEGNGNYRIELFNNWGSGTHKDSPFSNNAGVELGAETALSFNEIVITFTIASLSSNGSGTYAAKFATINPSWGGHWDYPCTGSIEVKYDNFVYSLAGDESLNVKYENSMPDGTIMTFVQIDNLAKFFPGTQSVLNSLKIDGQLVTGYDADKVANTGEGANYRLELWNCYGATKDNCAFGANVGDVMPGLAFSQSQELNFSVKSLFPVPSFE